MNQLLLPVPGVEELFAAQLVEPGFQRAEDRTRINMQSILPHLPTDAKVVVDLGCGSGRMTIAMYKLWNDQATYYMADGDVDNSKKISKTQWGVFTGKTKGFYNRRKLTTAFVKHNLGYLPQYITIDDAQHWSLYPTDVDLLLSMYAVGTHYPITMYEKVYPRILRPGATFIFTHNAQTGPIPNYFEVVYNAPDLWRLHAAVPESRNSRNVLTVAKFVT